jgi:hypothetical protein
MSDVSIIIVIIKILYLYEGIGSKVTIVSYHNQKKIRLTGTK